jgi:hypothetical protein
MFYQPPDLSVSAAVLTSVQRAVAASKKRPLFLAFGLGLVTFGVLGNHLLAGRNTKLSWDIEVTAWAFVLVLAGFLLVLRVLQPQLKTASLFAFALALVTVYSLIYAWTIGLLLVSSRGDYGHCEELIRGVSTSAPIPPSAFDPTKRAVFCMVANYGLFRTRYQILDIYGITDRATQDAILLKLTQVRHAEHTEVIQVLFFEKENVRLWKSDMNSASGGARGPESPLRIAVVH